MLRKDQKEDRLVDLYTKAVLTVIALALLVIATKEYTLGSASSYTMVPCGTGWCAIKWVAPIPVKTALPPETNAMPQVDECANSLSWPSCRSSPVS